MLSISDRSRRCLKECQGVFFFQIIMFAFGFCLLSQLTLGFFAFYESHHASMGNEITVFADAGLNEQQHKKLLGEIDKFTHGASVNKTSPKDVIDEDILKLVGGKGKVPVILTVSFPVTERFAVIENAVKEISSVKGVEGVSANLEWIRKRHTLREAIACSVVAFGVPAIVLCALIFIQGVMRLNEYFRQEQALLLMLGAKQWDVRAPLVSICLLAAASGCLLGGVLYLGSTYTAVPFLERAFEVQLLPSTLVNTLITLSLAAVILIFTAISAYCISGRTQPSTF